MALSTAVRRIDARDGLSVRDGKVTIMDMLHLLKYVPHIIPYEQLH